MHDFGRMRCEQELRGDRAAVRDCLVANQGHYPRTLRKARWEYGVPSGVAVTSVRGLILGNG